jgi:glycosyltransferase involved in cell wall biosynthesis
MKILVVSDSYPPEIRSASQLMKDLADELNHRGHEITVVTSWPRYNLSEKSVLTPLAEKNIEDGIDVIRVKSFSHHNVNYFIRGLAELFLPFIFFLKLLKYRINSDVVLIYSPPLPLAIVGILLKFFNKTKKIILNVQDLFPQNAIDLGIINKSYQIFFFRSLEKFAYKFSDLITFHSEGNLSLVKRIYIQYKYKFKLLHNWTNSDDFKKPRKIDFRKEWKINHKHVAIFAGVIGPSQFLELIIQIAKEFEYRHDLLFLIVGDGSEKNNLEKYAIRLKLKNVIFKGFIEQVDYQDLLTICSIGLVCLNHKNKTPVVPGKILGYMAAGLPVIGFLNKESDAHSVIRNAQCGYTANSDDFDSCIRAFKALLNDKRFPSKLGRNGLSYVNKNFSKEICINQFESFLG